LKFNPCRNAGSGQPYPEYEPTTDLTHHSPDLIQNSPDLTQNSPDLTQNSPDLTEKCLDPQGILGLLEGNNGCVDLVPVPVWRNRNYLITVSVTTFYQLRFRFRLSIQPIKSSLKFFSSQKYLAFLMLIEAELLPGNLSSHLS
jgi:hypothetical protein